VRKLAADKISWAVARWLGFERSRSKGPPAVYRRDMGGGGVRLCEREGRRERGRERGRERDRQTEREIDRKH